MQIAPYAGTPDSTSYIVVIPYAFLPSFLPSLLHHHHHRHRHLRVLLFSPEKMGLEENKSTGGRAGDDGGKKNKKIETIKGMSYSLK